jgi:hypothetical protein
LAEGVKRVAVQKNQMLGAKPNQPFTPGRDSWIGWEYELCHGFKVSQVKHVTCQPGGDLNCIGSIPTFDYFIDNGLYDSEKHGKYLELSKEFENKPWNLIEETKKYLYNDIKSLFEIIENFSKDVYDVERINITKIISISSLALKTFLTNYYDEERTPIHTSGIAWF